MRRNRTTHTAFTLIELLVVISIIALLSSVVLASLNTSRDKAKEASIMQLASEVRTTLELHRNEQKTFSGLVPGWIDVCNPASFTGSHAAKMVELCKKIVPLTDDSAGSTQDALYVGLPQSANTSAYTIIIRMPFQSKQAGGSRYYCLGSSGGSSNNNTTTWAGAGCYAHPGNQ